ncbi:MAG: hypothetical protein SVM86_08410, partial [Candidatus Cloacimonadota bacterium]|nr:hypothetical protein [Candidatus Cloacimonadota bacterium]
MKQDKIQSTALEVNLAETRKKKIVIPSKHRWFISLSEDYFGIHKRANEFMNEYHHPYPDYKMISDLLKKICLEDFWFYQQQVDSSQAISLLIDIFADLLQNAKQEYNSILHTLLKLAPQILDKNNLEKALQILDENYSEKYMENAAYFRNYLSKLGENEKAINLTKKVMADSLDFWQKTSEIEKWFEKKRKLFKLDYSETVKNIGKEFFQHKRALLAEAKDWEQLKQIPLYSDLGNTFRQFTSNFKHTIEKVYYLFYLLHLPGTKKLNNHLLWDMNRLLGIVKNELNHEQVLEFLKNIFQLFAEFKDQYASNVLDCISTLGKEIISLKENDLIDYFIENLIELGFIDPGQVIIREDWQLEVDPNHLKNIRVWLELIEMEPHKLQKLLSALIVNLRIGGIFISDTDLFQRDITKLLNSKM